MVVGSLKTVKSLSYWSPITNFTYIYIYIYIYVSDTDCITMPLPVDVLFTMIMHAHCHTCHSFSHCTLLSHDSDSYWTVFVENVATPQVLESRIFSMLKDFLSVCACSWTSFRNKFLTAINLSCDISFFNKKSGTKAKLKKPKKTK